MDRLCWTSRQHWWEQVYNMLADIHLSVKYKQIEPGSSLEARFTDAVANNYVV